MRAAAWACSSATTRNAQRLLQALAFARSVDTAAVAQRFAALGQAGPQIGEAIHAARIEALRQGFATPA